MRAPWQALYLQRTPDGLGARRRALQASILCLLAVLGGPVGLGRAAGDAGGGEAVAGDPEPCAVPLPSSGSGLQPVLTTEWVASDGYRSRVDVLLPAGPAPTCGWPLVVWVHPLGAGREEPFEQAVGLAVQGFAVALYDVRGQGNSMELNDPATFGRTLNGLREVVDLAEIIETVPTWYPAEIDSQRVAVTGTSQGGWHAWLAASLSSRFLPPNPWRDTPFPRIRAVAARGNDGSPWFGGPGKLAFTEWERLLLFETTEGVHWKPQELAIGQAAFLSQDLTELNFQLEQFDHRFLLPITVVPVLAHLAHEDSVFRSRDFVQNAKDVGSFSSSRFVLGSGVHGAPSNLLDDARFAWDRLLFLRDHLSIELPSGEAEALSVSASPWRARILPRDEVPYLDPSTLWDRRDLESLPASNFALFLTSAGTLGFQAPPSGFDVPLGYEPGAGYDPGVLSKVGAKPLPGPQSDLRVFESPAAPKAVQLIGRPRFRGLVRSSESFGQLNLRLSDVGLDGSSRFLCAGDLTRDDVEAGAFGYWTVVFDSMAHTLRTGHRLRLEVEAITRQPYPGSPNLLRELPLFEPFDLTLRGRPEGPLLLRLPVASPAGPRIVVYPPAIAAGETVLRVGLTGNPDQAGWIYQVFPTFAGAGESEYMGITVPLLFDEVTADALLFGAAPPYFNFQGVLETGGVAEAQLLLSGTSSDPAMTGSVLTVLGLLRAPDGAVELTEPTEIFFLGP